MATYPFHDQSFYNVIVDSSYSSSSSLMFPNTNISLPQSLNSINMSGILEEPNNNNNNNNNSSTGACLFSNSGNNSGISVLLQNHPPLPNMDHKRKYCNSSNHTSFAFNSNTPPSKDTLEVLVSKGKKQRKITVSNSDDGPMLKGSNDNEERKKKKKIGRRASCNNKKNKIEKVQQEEQVATEYVHVRARRGQATDSHSLAERVRREKIGERMKILQALVPGCDKVTGKALMLDEIINYVQSLQNQIEFLSMKIGSVNPMFHDFGMDLDTLMIKPEGSSLEEEAHQADVQNRCSPKQSTTNSFNTTTAPSPNNYSFPLLDPSAVLLFQQAQMSNILSQSQPQNNGQLLWDNAEQGHKLFTPYSSFTNNLPPFH